MTELEQTIDSREIAEMVEKDHCKLLRDIHRYVEQFNEAKIGFVDFFEESTYKDAKGETSPCYRITKKGCEFIAHKLTGTKGTIFTARYINRFHEMEAILSEPPAAVAPVQLDLIKDLTKEYAELRKEVDSLKEARERKNKSKYPSIPYEDSVAYKSLALQMLQQTSVENERIFLQQIYTMLHVHRKNMENKQKST